MLWDEGYCPFCMDAKAERERIADAIEAKAAEQAQHSGSVVSAIRWVSLMDAALIARGDA